MGVCTSVCTDVLPVCMPVWHVHEVYLKARIGGGSSGTRVIEVPCQSSVRAISALDCRVILQPLPCYSNFTIINNATAAYLCED